MMLCVEFSGSCNPQELMLCVVCIQTSNNTQLTSDRITSFAHECFTGVPHLDPLFFQ